MRTINSLRRLLWMPASAVMFVTAAPASAFFNLDYVVVGRIWVPSLGGDLQGLPKTGRVAALSDFGDCVEQGATREQLLEPRDRDCRFERQLAGALVQSGLFRRVMRAPRQGEAVDLILSPRRSRVQFRRQVISAVKPLVVLTLFTYLWTPLPFEVDVESYDLGIAIRDSRGRLLLEVAVAREFSHRLSPYSEERTPPADLVAAMAPAERELGPLIVCRGPHSAVVVRQLLERIAAAVMNLAAVTQPPEGHDVVPVVGQPFATNEAVRDSHVEQNRFAGRRDERGNP